jgi:hypothetical protein
MINWGLYQGFYLGYMHYLDGVAAMHSRSFVLPWRFLMLIASVCDMHLPL